MNAQLPEETPPSILGSEVQAPHSEKDELRQHLQALQRRLPLIGVIVLACTALATLRTLRMPAVYASHSRVRMAKEAPDPIQSTHITRWQGIQREYLNTQIQILMSRDLAQRVIANNPDIARQLEVDGGLTDMQDQPGYSRELLLASSFLMGVLVTPVKDTYLVDVGYESTDPERCAPYANALAEAYIDQLEQVYGRRTREAEDSISRQAETILAKLEKSELELREYLESKNIALGEHHEEILLQQISSNKSALAEAGRNRNRLDAQLDAIQRVLDRNLPLHIAPGIATNDIVRSLRRELGIAERRLDALRTQGYGDNWPEVLTVRTQRDQLRLQLRQEIQDIRSQQRSHRDELVSEEKGLQQRMRQLSEEFRTHTKLQQRYETLSKEVDANRRFYEQLTYRQKEVMSRKDISSSNVRVVDTATGSYRVRPNHLRNVAAGLVIGLVLGVLVALLLERLADRIRNPQEALNSLRLPILGVVPDVSEVSGKELDRYAITNSRSIYAEAFRRARVQLDAVGAYPSEGCGVMLCSSGVPKEGKTLCAVNLAVASAQAGKRTLLIDGDMRSPRIHNVFELQVSPGLTDVLESPQDALQAVMSTEIPNLDVLPAGKTRDNPAELLSKSGFLDVVAGLRAHYDRIVIDSPPVAYVSDGAQMAPAADVTLLIVSGKESSRTMSVLARTELTRVGAEPVGVLFNQQGPGEGYYYSYRYRYYYQQRYTDPDSSGPPA